MKKHILLIDDDKDELVIFMDALRRIPDEDGFKCTYASNPGQAIEMLKYLVPDYIFTDFNIPKMNGLEFLAFISNQAKFQNTGRYLYSTHLTDEIKIQAAELGAGCVLKPATIGALTEELSGILSGRPKPSIPYLSAI